MSETLELIAPADATRAAILKAWARRRGINLRTVEPHEVVAWRKEQAALDGVYPRTCVQGHTITGPEDEYRKLTRPGSGKYRMICRRCDNARKLRRKRKVAP